MSCVLFVQKQKAMCETRSSPPLRSESIAWRSHRGFVLVFHQVFDLLTPKEVNYDITMDVTIWVNYNNSLT